MEELLNLESLGWESLCNRRGADFYGQTMTDNGVMILSNGLILNREQVIASLNGAPPWSRYKISQERLISLGEDAAVLVYRGTAWRGESREPEFQAWMSSTYVRRQSQWKLACYQQTPSPTGE